MAQQRVGRARRRADAVGHLEEVDRVLALGGQALPRDAAVEPQAGPLRGPQHTRRRTGGSVADDQRLDRLDGGRDPVGAVEELVERHVERGDDRVERADRGVGLAVLDLRDEARRDADFTGESAYAQPPTQPSGLQALRYRPRHRRSAVHRYGRSQQLYLSGLRLGELYVASDFQGSGMGHAQDQGLMTRTVRAVKHASVLRIRFDEFVGQKLHGLNTDRGLLAGRR